MSVCGQLGNIGLSEILLRRNLGYHAVSICFEGFAARRNIVEIHQAAFQTTFCVGAVFFERKSQ